MRHFRVGAAAAVLILLTSCSGNSDAAKKRAPGGKTDSSARTVTSGDRLGDSGLAQVSQSAKTLAVSVAPRSTRVLSVRPVNALRKLASGYQVGQTFATVPSQFLPGGCFPGSTVATAAYRCFATDNGIYDPCWVESSPVKSVLCLRSPWSTTVTRLRLSGPLGALAPRSPVSGPWGLQLSNGWKCLAIQGTRDQVNGRFLFYDCGAWSSGRVVLEGINRSRPLWQVQTATRSVRGVYRLGPSVTVVNAYYAKQQP